MKFDAFIQRFHIRVCTKQKVIDNQSINQLILYFSVEQNVTEYNEGCKITNVKKI